MIRRIKVLSANSSDKLNKEISKFIADLPYEDSVEDVKFHSCYSPKLKEIIFSVCVTYNDKE